MKLGRYVIIGKEDCAFCKNAVNLLQQKGDVAYNYSQIEDDVDFEHMREFLSSKKIRHTTMPCVFYYEGMAEPLPFPLPSGKNVPDFTRADFVGGFMELVQHHKGLKDVSVS